MRHARALFFPELARVLSVVCTYLFTRAGEAEKERRRVGMISRETCARMRGEKRVCVCLPETHLARRPSTRCIILHHSAQVLLARIYTPPLSGAREIVH